MKQILSRGWYLARSATARSAYTLLAGNLTDSILAFLFTLISFRLLSTADFGIFSAVNNFVFTCVQVLDLGIGGSLLHFIPYWQSHRLREKEASYIWSGIIFRVGAAVAAGTFLLVFSHQIAGFFRTPDVLVPVIAGMSLITISILDVLVFALQGYRKFFHSVLAANIFSCLRFLFVAVVWITLLPYSVVLATLISAVSPVLSIFLSRRWLRLPSFTLPRPGVFRSLLGFSGWMALSKISSTIATRMDIQIIILFLGPALAGVYSVAARLANFYPVMFVSITSILAARLIRISDRRHAKTFLGKTLVAFCLIGCAMLIGAAVASPLIGLLFGRSALPAAPFFRGLTLAYLPMLFSVLPLGMVIYYFKLPRLAGWLGLTQLMITLTGNLLLTPVWGPFGPVISIGVANALVLLMGLVIVYRLWKSA